MPVLSPTSQCQMWLDFFSLSGSNERRVRLERLERVAHDGQRFVVDLHRRGAVGGGVAALGEDRHHFLPLEFHGVDGEHHLGVRHQRRHPGELSRIQVLARDHGENAGDGQRLFGDGSR